MRINLSIMNKRSQFRWVGVDSPGDITQPAMEFAVWFAHQRRSPSVEIRDFLSALFLLAERESCKRWKSSAECKSYMWRADIAGKSQEHILQEACDWLFSGAFHLPLTGISGQIRGPGKKRPGLDLQLELFVESVQKTARLHKLQWPTIDCILATLIDQPKFGEDKAIRLSGVNEPAIRQQLAGS